MDVETMSNETDDHLPIVQIELDKLNYANESINNLEIELEESKKEYIRTLNDSEKQLNEIEKKLGNCVERVKPYYQLRTELRHAKENYLKAKNKFETAQELYVAAKKMQLYAEESLDVTADPDSILKPDENQKNLTKMLEIARLKVTDTELFKHSSDSEQIEANRIYEEKMSHVEQLEKELRKQIEKSKIFFITKSQLNKELRFLFIKIEGLKNCLKEAKSAYQLSLRNLESISTEIHKQREATLHSNSSDDFNESCESE